MTLWGCLTGKPKSPAPERTTVLELSDEDDRVKALRYKVYAEELGQYRHNPDKQLADGPALADRTICIVAWHDDGQVAGFVLVTGPGPKRFQDHGVRIMHDKIGYEIRSLTVAPTDRKRGLALALMYAALRYIEASCGKHIVALARTAILPLYLRVGMRAGGDSVVCGGVDYTPVLALRRDMRLAIQGMTVPPHVRWNLPFPLERSAGYGPGALAVQIAQVGKDARAQHFLKELDDDPVVGGMIDCTSYYELEAKEFARNGITLTPELWLMKLCLGAISPEYDSKDL